MVVKKPKSSQSIPAKGKAKVPAKVPAKATGKASSSKPAVKVSSAKGKTNDKHTSSKPSTPAKESMSKTKESVAKSTPVKSAPTPKNASSTPVASVPQSGAGGTLGFLGIAPYQLKKGEDYMSSTQESHFRNILREWKKVLMEEVDRTVHHMQDEAANFPDPNDRATQESEFTMELRARDRERKLIKKIDEANMALDSHEYGYCEQCGEEIGIRRLEARPTATLCIECKTLAEIRERHIST